MEGGVELLLKCKIKKLKHGKNFDSEFTMACHQSFHFNFMLIIYKYNLEDFLIYFIENVSINLMLIKSIIVLINIRN